MHISLVRGGERVKLKVGKMSTKELAKWFGIAYSTFRKRSSALLEELKYFCDYEKYHGGVEIKQVYISEYVKDLTSKDSEVYLALVKESGNCLCSIAGMARKLNLLYPDTWGKLSFYAVEKRLRKAGIALFGETNLPSYREQEERYSGPYGYKEYCWAIKVSDLNEYRFLTEEEDKMFDILLESYNVTKKDVALKEAYDKEKLQAFKENKITKEEYILAMEHSELFPNLLSKFREQTGLTLVRSTYHEVLESAFN